MNALPRAPGQGRDRHGNAPLPDFDPIRYTAEMSPPRLTSLGYAVAALAMTGTALGLLLLSSALCLGGLIGLLLLVGGRCLAARHLQGFVLERDLPRRVRAGESFPMEIRCRPGSAAPFGAPYRLSVPYAPARRERPLGPIRPEGDWVLFCTGLSQQRGRLPSLPWRLVSTWPLGLFQTERQGAFQGDRPTLVHPRPWLPAPLQIHLERLARPDAEPSLEVPDPLAEFRWLREFRPGDAVRGIPWPASLRAGSLLYRETEPPLPRRPRYALVLHSAQRPGSVVVPEAYERLIRIAAGLLQHFRHRGIETVFCQAPGSVHRLRRPRDFEARLDQLALSRRPPSLPLDALFAPAQAAASDPFLACDEVFVLGDTPKEYWEPAARARFPHCTCIDADGLHLGTRPTLLTPSSRSPREAISA